MISQVPVDTTFTYLHTHDDRYPRTPDDLRMAPQRCEQKPTDGRSIIGSRSLLAHQLTTCEKTERLYIYFVHFKVQNEQSLYDYTEPGVLNVRVNGFQNARCETNVNAFIQNR